MRKETEQEESEGGVSEEPCDEACAREWQETDQRELAEAESPPGKAERKQFEEEAAKEPAEP